MGTDSRLGGRPRTRCKQIVRARNLPCPMCGYPIDQTRNRMGRADPLSSAVDEWLPRALGGDPHDPDQCVDMHRICNSIKWKHWPVTQAMQDEARAKIEALLGRPQPLQIQRPW